MKILFVSNYFNHHQRPFCEEIHKRQGIDFAFISTGVMRDERKKLGYTQNDIPEYVFTAYGDEKKQKIARDMINAADVVIAGSAPEEMLSERLSFGKLVLRYSERPFKKKISLARRLYHLLRFHRRDMGDQNVYLLCAGAYAAKDFAGMGLYKNRMYKWGYFPQVKEYDPDTLLDQKKRNTILWCGRFIDWKHPDDAVEVARKLRDSGYDFNLNMIGSGVMEAELRQLVEDYDLGDCVHFLGSMPPEQVRVYMEEAGIYLLTSDRQEGWGAVLNEAMNSGCAVVASHEVGSVTYLLKHRQNGLIYKSGSVDDLYEKTGFLLETADFQRCLSENAYRTIANVWNANKAADNLLQLIEHIQNGGNHPWFEDGPCSRADIMREDWFID